MTAKLKNAQDDPKQSQRFVETAKVLEADESGKAFELEMKKLFPNHSSAKKAPPA